ncbi:MAG TPA: CaiB/BaiF CoA-transferase family protein [Candidatus Tectomicrobia bacterium]|nr:CaiB/BaiF CoA-transferase family protein [Candidatus Tectomicrobia bacterium]
MTLPLEPYAVIDLTRARSGPTCVRQLADMGARVVKVENKADQDDFARDQFDFQNLHRNKRSITLDLKHPRGVEVLERMVAQADVLVENYRPDVKHRLGIDYETLSAINPRLIYASISGFGQTGPYRDRPGYDQIAQGLGGLMSITGLPGQGPVRAGIPVADLTAGIFLAQGVLVALLERERSGRGQWVHTSLLQAMVTMLDFQATRWLIGKEIPPQAGNDHPTGIPTGVFRTADGHINIAAAGQTMFRRLCAALDTAALVDDPRFATPPDRSKNRAALTVELEKALVKRTSAEWVEILNRAGVPCGPILNIEEVFEDPQVQHLRMATTVTHPRLGELTVQNLPVTLSRTPGAVRTPTPDMGQHTDEVLAELGYSSEEIAELRRDGVV